MDGRLSVFIFRIIVTFCLHFCISAENIALHKHASQSGNYYQNSGPNLAVDGDATYQGWCAWASASTNDVVPGETDPLAWWSVDLASQDPSQRFIVTSVTICFNDNQDSDTVIYAGEESGWQRQTECGHTILYKDTQTIPCSPDKPVRYLTIRHQTSFLLSLCEVYVNGYRYQDTSMPMARTISTASSTEPVQKINPIVTTTSTLGPRPASSTQTSPSGQSTERPPKTINVGKTGNTLVIIITCTVLSIPVFVAIIIILVKRHQRQKALVGSRGKIDNQESGRTSETIDHDNHNTKTVAPEDSTLGYHGNSPQSDYLTPFDNADLDPSTEKYESLKWPKEGSGSANYRASQSSVYLTVYDPPSQYTNLQLSN